MGDFSSCLSMQEGQLAQQKDWPTDPEWIQMKYGQWGGPGVSQGPGPMDDILVKNHAPRRSVIAEETIISKARFPVIDVHAHRYPEAEEGENIKAVITDWVHSQKEVGVDKTIILTNATGGEFDALVDLYLEPYPEQFRLFCGLDKSNIDDPDYPERAAQELERCYEMGARGIGELSDKGFGFTRNPDLAPEARLHPDDDRLDLFWQKAAALDLPVNIHIADHPSAWTPPDVFQERTPIFQQYNKYGGSGETYEEILQHLPNLLQKHTETTFIACHLANQGNDLKRLSNLLDQFPNLFLDISARDYEMGRMPRGTKKFIERFHDRVLFGTDMGMDKNMYLAWWRLLESDDEYMTGRIWWPYYGLGLTADSLEALYRGNALRILNWQ
ncbi:MAG: amidohydrolase family protein [Saprospiraceae bacterium]|nr:amidohydrolase family protein [Saprospiraceae bacterium]